MQIREIRDPALFQAMVRALMVAERGVSNYQVVDDAGGDGGLDGFDRSNGELHAVYCPTKPERLEVERDRIIRKIRSDLRKAVALRDEGAYPVQVFAFVTPSTLREPLQRLVRDEAKTAGFTDGICIAGESLETLLGRHPYVLEQFPAIALPRLAPQIASIEEALTRLAGNAAGTDPPIAPADAGASESGPAGESEPRGRTYDRFLLRGVESPAVGAAEEALACDDGDAGLAQLALARAEADDGRVLVAAAIVEQGYWLRKHNPRRGAEVCESGIKVAQQMGMRAEEAALRALLARHLAVDASGIDLDQTVSILAARRTGLPLYDESDWAPRLQHMRMLSARVEREINEALRLVHSGGAYNLDAMYWTYAMVGAIEAYMLTPRRLMVNLGDSNRDELSAAQHRIQAAHEAAIRIAVLNGPPSHIRALENAANDLRLAGEWGIALALARRACEVAESTGHAANSAPLLIDALEHDIAAASGR
ncbi:MAG TPA: hypothetical protein VF584_16480 [Longimicrobium sp.]|jgi:hypothetical protein